MMSFGLSQARRGWADKPDILNAWPLELLLKMLNLRIFWIFLLPRAEN